MRKSFLLDYQNMLSHQSELKEKLEQKAIGARRSGI
jgi:hypothetical protein